jgi:sugar/nucleoside kinase (ribokinase family)
VLCCIGDLVEDIVVERTATIATGADTDVVITRRRGGSAANVAVAAARLGCDVRFFGRVGADAIGEGLVAELAASGVAAVVQRLGRTGTILVLIEPDGERSMLRDRGAAADLDRLDEPGLAGATWLHVPAYSLVDGAVASVASTALMRAREAGIATSVDASSTTVVDALTPEGFAQLIGRLRPTVVFANVDEARALPPPDAWSGFDGVAIIKDGPRPVRAVDATGNVISEADAMILGEIRDTTGAGDAFAAGFIAARMRDETLPAALGAGHASAAARLSMYQRDDV